MHSDPEAIRKSVRSLHLMVFVALFVLHGDHRRRCRSCTSRVPVAITVALIIATIKGSMVAGVFMHLSHEKQVDLRLADSDRARLRRS